MTAFGHALDGNRPTLMQQVTTGDNRADHRENRREEGKRSQQLLNEVELRGSYDGQGPATSTFGSCRSFSLGCLFWASGPDY